MQFKNIPTFTIYQSVFGSLCIIVFLMHFHSTDKLARRYYNSDYQLFPHFIFSFLVSPWLSPRRHATLSFNYKKLKLTISTDPVFMSSKQIIWHTNFIVLKDFLCKIHQANIVNAFINHVACINNIDIT